MKTSSSVEVRTAWPRAKPCAPIRRS